MNGCNGQRTGQGSARSAAVESGMTRTAHSDAREELTQERLRELMAYDPATGNFIRASRTWRGKPICGWIRKDGYRSIAIDGKGYMAHKLVWFYVHGSWPKNEIDHINGVRDDNRFSNLREATRAENSRNAKKRKDNKSGRKGVIWWPSRGRWVAKIRVDGRSYWLGSFRDLEEAAAAYDRAAKEMHGEFMRPNFDEFENL